MNSNFSIFFLLNCVFGVQAKYSLPNPRKWGVIPIFSFKICTFSLLHCGALFILSHVDIQYSHTCWKGCSFPLNSLGASSKISCPRIRGSFWILGFMLLISMSVLTPVCYCFDSSIVVSFEIKKCGSFNLFLPFQGSLGMQGHSTWILGFAFPFLQSGGWNLEGNVLNFLSTLDITDIFKKMESSSSLTPTVLSFIWVFFSFLAMMFCSLQFASLKLPLFNLILGIFYSLVDGIVLNFLLYCWFLVHRNANYYLISNWSAFFSTLTYGRCILQVTDEFCPTLTEPCRLHWGVCTYILKSKMGNTAILRPKLSFIIKCTNEVDVTCFMGAMLA